ncbi:MAG TPA: hypothetical protein VHY37_11195, partial [Tepidisphaeraceae bacterium]|nr:hypothetical protein [Tepidisphaeraceae bacterium]
TAAVRDISVALMDASRVIGLGICQATGHELIMPYRLIGTNHRGGWANVLMLAEGASMLAARGIRRAQFIATARTPDAQAAANLYGARPMLCRERYMLPLPKSPGPRGVNQS